MVARYLFDPFELDLARRQLSRDGRSIELQPKVFAVLALLVTEPGIAIARDAFLDRIWSGRFVTENVLARCILQLRHTLGDDAAHPTFIRTLRGHGYQFIAPVKRISLPADDLPSPRSVAVLEFQSVMQDERSQALQHGLAETLTHDLSRHSHLIVKPSSAVADAQTSAGTADPLVLGRLMDVDAVVDGSLQLDAGRLRVNVRALRVTDGTTLVAERCEVPADDLFTVQDRICEHVIHGLSLGLGEQSTSLGQSRHTRHADAYRAYVDGRLKLAEHNVQAVTQALESFNQALRIDSEYIEAMVASAEAHEFLGTLGAGHAVHYKQMRELCERAIRHDESSARAYCCLGKIAWQFDWQWSESERLLGKALALDRNDSEVLIAMSDFLAYQRRYDEALETAERAGEINPFSPWIHALITQALYMGGQLEEAIEQGRRAVALAPNFGFSQFFLGLSLLQLERYGDAIDQIRQAMAQSGREDFIGMLGYALARGGDRAGALAILARLDASARAGAPVPPIAWAAVHHGLGNETLAIDQFRLAMENRSWHVLLLHAEPAFATLRTRPEAGALLRQLNLDDSPGTAD